MIEQFWKKILYRRSLSLLSVPAAFLWLLSLLYALSASLHRLRTGKAHRLSLPVISVGNIAVGGSGKTPLVILLAQRLQDEGLRIGIVSCGYGRESSASWLDSGYKISLLSSKDVGDEVKFMSEQLPRVVFSVDKSKLQAAQRLGDSGQVDLIIVDDGFQHHSLWRDINIVSYDGSVPARLLRRFPAGILREPLKALKRADIIIITRSNFAKDIYKLQSKLAGINGDAEIYTANFVANELVGRQGKQAIKYLQDKAVFLFAGIGNFRHFRKQISSLVGDLTGWIEFSDHQDYTQKQLETIRSKARDSKADMIVTTGKDWVKLGDFDFGCDIYYLNLSIDLNPGEERLTQRLLKIPGLKNRKS